MSVPSDGLNAREVHIRPPGADTFERSARIDRFEELFIQVSPNE
jgi:hypothetical protein